MASCWRQTSAPRLSGCFAQGFARGVQGSSHIAPAIRRHLVVTRRRRICIRLHPRFVPDVVRAFAVEEDGVLDVPVSAPLEVLGVALDTSDFVAKVGATEDFIQHHFHVVPNFCVGVHIDRADIAQRLPQCDDARFEEIEILVKGEDIRICQFPLPWRAHG